MSVFRGEVLVLYRQLLKESSKFSSYMYRTYALRRVRDAFREHKEEKDNQKIKDLLVYGKENLEVIKRQVIIDRLYKGPENVIERTLQDSEKAFGGG